MIKLDIGCSDVKVEKDWVGVDPYCEAADVKAFAWELPYEDNSIVEIRCFHTLEHIAKLKILPTLKEWHRVLMLFGKLTVRVPDLAWCCKWWLEHQTTGWDMDIIFGTQGRKGEFHKTGFNRTIMENYLKEAGFKIEKFEEMETHSQKTLSFECRKI